MKRVCTELEKELLYKNRNQMLEGIYHSYIIGDNTMTVKVYEWNDGQVQLCEYPAGNVAMNTVYGSMLYKFTTRKGLKGDYVLVNISPVGKKRK